MVPAPAEDRELRAGQNQALFREVNERIEELNGAFSGVSSHGSWICECANENCVERVDLTLAEYEAIRDLPERFVVRPADAHVRPDVEHVVARHERYWVVEKTGVAAQIAAETYERTEA